MSLRTSCVTTTSHSLSSSFITTLSTIISGPLVSLRNELASLSIQVSTWARLPLSLGQVCSLDILMATSAMTPAASAASRETGATLGWLALLLLLRLALVLLRLLLLLSLPTKWVLLLMATTPACSTSPCNRQPRLESSKNSTVSASRRFTW